MKSEEILPKKYRLTEFQKTQLEGFKSIYHSNIKDHFQGHIYSQAELLLKYNEALKEAEKEIEYLKENQLGQPNIQYMRKYNPNYKGD